MPHKQKRFWLWFGAGFCVAAMVTACILVPLRFPRPDVVGYFGSIAGGLAGGAMTVLAGWLAWSAAQKQIRQQERLIELTVEEHRERTRKLIMDCYYGLDAVEFELARRAQAAISEGAALPAMTPSDAIALIYFDASRIQSDSDAWRISRKVMDDLLQISFEVAALNYWIVEEQDIALDSFEDWKSPSFEEFLNKNKALRRKLSALKSELRATFWELGAQKH